MLNDQGPTKVSNMSMIFCAAFSLAAFLIHLMRSGHLENVMVAMYEPSASKGTVEIFWADWHCHPNFQSQASRRGSTDHRAIMSIMFHHVG